MSSRIDGSQSLIQDMTDQMADIDQRLTLREAALRQQYTDLETALSSLQSQQQWLTGQLSSL